MAVCSLQKENDCITRNPQCPTFSQFSGPSGGCQGPIGLGSRGCLVSLRAPACRPLSAPEIPPWEFRCDQRLWSGMAWPGRCAACILDESKM